ncbi:MAG: permease prefix domain 1-containing protein [Defluviitaleaceae bacterium]|nr:permease prefix domain 1-containing protein [Defluviitaleaceae bacterium]MCL2275490.1 permease prefix domain 1-containing protein [Defluviitaleaceae bacterium]
MNSQRINKLVNDLFYDIQDTPEVREQKEELRIHLTERVNDHMAEGYTFEDALQLAKESLGNPRELVEGFPRKKVVEWEDLDDDYGVNFRFRFSKLFTRLTPLSPFIYIILGVTQNSWMPWLPFEMASWWLWGWMIIPVIAILSSGVGFYSLPAIAPFIYLFIGFAIGGTWWAWGWMIIPICAILCPGGGKKKRKKKKKKYRYEGDVFDAVGDIVDHAVETATNAADKAIDAATDWDNKNNDRDN